MKNLNVDVAVIGSGTAGLSAYRSAGEQGCRAVIIEGGEYGTTCARVGCMPSKLFIAASDAAHSVRTAAGFGIRLDCDPVIDGKKVMSRVRSERDRFVGFVLESVDGFDEADKVRGYARFIDKNTLKVGDHTVINAKAVVIATGSSPVIPDELSGLGEKVITSERLFYWKDLPGAVAVFGAGIIGLELGQALHRLGVRTTVFGRDGAVGPLSDSEILGYSKAVFKDELEFYPDADVRQITTTDRGISVTYRDDENNLVTGEYDYVLAAAGRSPNVGDLGLENTGIELDDRDVPVFDRYTMRCGESNIFIAGDANSELPLLHEASDEGKIAGTNAAIYPDIRSAMRRAHLSIVFTDPQMAISGARCSDLKDGLFVTGQVSFEDQGRSRVILKNRGILRVYAEYGSGRFLGAEMFAPSAEHIGHLLSWAIQKNMTVPQMLEMPFYHPVIEEGLRTALRDVNQKLRMGPPMVNKCLECGPGA